MDVERRRARGKRYTREHRAYYKEYCRLWRRRNRDRTRLYDKQQRPKRKGRHIKYKEMVLNAYGNKCACCGETHIEFLTIDHINGNGAEHRRHLKVCGGTAFYRWLIKNDFPVGYQVLCWNCNCAKGMCGYCPHQKET